MNEIIYSYTILESEMQAMNDLLAMFSLNNVEIVNEEQLDRLVRLDISFPNREVLAFFDNAFVELMG